MSTMQIPRAPLRSLAEGGRFASMDRSEAYYRGRQDDGKMYDWDGLRRGYGAEASIKPGWYVPHNMRRPNSRYDLGRLIVRRLTSMVFGQDHFPEIVVAGDEEAEDYARELAIESRLPVRIAEARNLGGACGTACLSFGFVDGKPRVSVHNPKHVMVMEWEDESELRPSAVIKAFSYPRPVYDPEKKKVVMKTYWTVRWWDSVREICWKNIPEAVALTLNWQDWPERKESAHNYGFTPFYWIQNRPCSGEHDGEGDFQGLEGTMDEVNRLLSATTKGTIANVDPTLVVKADPATNNGQLRKGSENAIFAPGGADYLELKGTAVQAAERQIDRLVRSVLDVAGVILADPEKLSGAAQSARALEILYAPMLANCDVLREQYGEHGIKPILRDMLFVSRMYQSAPPVMDESTGELVQARVMLSPRMERSESGEEIAVERTPGQAENVTLNWRPYFAPTWTDIGLAVRAAKEANGGKPTISQRTGVQAVSTLFGVKDVDAEMEAIEEEAEKAIEQAQKTFEAQSGGGLFDTGGGPEPDDEDDDEDDDA